MIFKQDLSIKFISLNKIESKLLLSKFDKGKNYLRMGALGCYLSFAQYFNSPAGVDIWPQQNPIKVLIGVKSHMTWALTMGFCAKSCITIGFSLSHGFRTINIVTQVYCRIYVMHNFFCLTIFKVFSTTTTPASLATINPICKYSIRATKKAYSYQLLLTYGYWISPMKTRSLWQGKTHP